MKLYRMFVCLFVFASVGDVECCASEVKDIFDKLTHGRMDGRRNGVERMCHHAHSRFLSEKYLPPASLKYVFCPAHSDEDMDMVKMRYVVGEEVFSITQTECVFVITVDRDGNNGTSEQKTSVAQAIARRILKNGGDLVFEKVDLVFEKKGEIDGCIFGRCQEMGRDQEVWLDELLWWSDQDLVGLAFLKKYSKDSTSHFLSYSPVFNQYWFKKKERTEGK